jgi:Stealth protein CR2, conserved region 2/Stealth protein CR1, conserved region 1
MHDSSPIDIVYLWVDGHDPAWRSKRKSRWEALGQASRDTAGRHGNVEGRFRDNDELRYSLRALDYYFPEHGHVYLVTDSQRPSWLKSSGRLTVIDHRDLIPAHCLPTFDSANIESYIHRIANLSERYFYLNDDVFFGAPVRVEDWFWEGGMYAAWSGDAPVSAGPLMCDADPMANACRLSQHWLDEQMPASFTDAIDATAAATVAAAVPKWQRLAAYQHTHCTFAHAPRPMLRSLLFKLEEIAPELFSQVRSTVFRSWDKPTIVSDFVIRWALAHGVAKIRDYTQLHIATGDTDLPYQLDLLASLAGSVNFFCINDTTDNAPIHDPRLAQARVALQDLLPEPSHFERTVPARPVSHQSCMIRQGNLA